jgi:hypothetical protein
MEISDMTKVMCEAIDAMADYAKEKEMQNTERRRIAACLEAVKNQIESDRNKFELFLLESFKEREKLYSIVENTLNIATEKGDTEMAKLTLNFILQVYNKNPLDGLKSLLDGSKSNLLLGSNNIKNYIE